MIIAYHVIISAYGFWLPNDPRGSWSDFVGSWELYKFGPATKVKSGRSYAKDPHDRERRLAAKHALKFAPLRFNDPQRVAIAEGFARACAEGRYECRACCIGHDHAHFVLERHERDLTRIVAHVKSRATQSLIQNQIHPLAQHTDPGGTLPSPWSEGCWKVFIDDASQREAAIRYVERHPEKEALPAQHWSFVHPRSYLAGELARRPPEQSQKEPS